MAASPRPRERFSRHVAFLFSGSAIAQVITVLAAPVTSRLFPPEAFGVAAVFTALVLLLAPIATLRYEQALMLPGDDEEAAHVFVAGWIALAAVVVLVAVGMYAGPTALFEKLDAVEVLEAPWLLPVALFGWGATTLLKFWQTRREAFKSIAAARVGLQGTTSASSILGGLLGFQQGVHLASFRTMGYYGEAGVLAVRYVRSGSARLLAKVRLSRVGGLARRYIKFPVLSVPESLMEVGSREVPILLLGLLFTSEEVGHFSRARTLLSLPLWVLSAAVAQVYYQRVASVYAAGGSVRRITEQVAKRLLRYALPPFALLPLLGPGLFAFVLGRRWEEAGVFAALLAPLIFFRFAMRPLMQLVYVFERQGAGALFTALLLLTQGGGILLGAHLGSPRLAIGAASFSGGLLIAGFIAWLLRIAGVPLLRIVADLLRASLSTGLLLAGVYFFQRATELHYLAELAVAAVLLAGIYAFWIWRDPELLANLRRRDS